MVEGYGCQLKQLLLYERLLRTHDPTPSALGPHVDEFHLGGQLKTILFQPSHESIAGGCIRIAHAAICPQQPCDPVCAEVRYVRMVKKFVCNARLWVGPKLVAGWKGLLVGSENVC